MARRPSLLLVACLLLALLTLFAFLPVLRNGFIDFDDDEYVTRNAHVQRGLTASNLVWAWTTTHAANWHPLTWISHMLDWELYGSDPSGHHLTSLLLHLANTILLFLVLERATGSWAKSAAVAALFGVHPLHVESVAWVAERKDVLSTLFWMLATWAYVCYAEGPGIGRYLLVAAAMALGLTAKPMLVTIPFTFLLLDFWPLSRWAPWPRVREKLPLLALSVASSAMTLFAQRRGQAVATMEVFPLAIRLENAVVSYVAYLSKTVWPKGLSFFYPHPRHGLPWWQVAGCALLLAVLTFAAVRARSRRPYFLVGWLWYLGTLLPVIGLVQVGSQARADRYTYVPLVGIFVIVAWGVPDLVASLRSRRGTEVTRWLVLPAAAVLLALAAAARAEVGHWRDSGRLFGDALRVSEDNYLAHLGMGWLLSRQGRVEEAISHYTVALRLRPDYAMTRSNLAGILTGQGRLDEAYQHATEAVRLDPNLASARFNLGIVLGKQGRTEEAIRQYEEALRIDPDDPRFHNNLSNLLSGQGRLDEAFLHATEAVRLDPNLADAHYNLGVVLGKTGRTEEAIRQYEQALKIDPDDAAFRNNLGSALARQGRMEEAIPQFQSAIAARPDYGVAHANLGAALFAMGRYAEAWKEVQRARQLGFDVPAPLVRDLSGKMAEPGGR